MSYTPITTQPQQLPINEDETKIYDLEKLGVPSGATEVLVYLFASIRDSDLETVTRSFYETYTENRGVQYKQYMNVIFTKGDYVMNSANLWFPLLPGQKKLTVHLTKGYPWERKKVARSHRSIADAMKSYAECQENDEIFAELFVIGYRTAAK